MLGSITAIVPTYNRADYLSQAIEALLGQSRPLHQIIIWDDGSDDHTADVMAGFKGHSDPEILCQASPNGGKSRALNAAMELATGDYIWICDDDDLVLPNAAEVLGLVLDTEAVDWVAGRHIRFHDAANGRRITFDTGYWPDLSAGSVLRHLLEDIFFFQPGTLVRRTAYDAVGPFNETISRSIDYEMFVRLAVRFPVKILDQVVFEQRKHDGDRGSTEARHSAAQSEAVWKSTDRAVFSEFRETLPLSLYEGLFEGGNAGSTTRAALLQRGCVYARRADWDAAVSDFEAALRLQPQIPLSTTEQAIAVRAMAGKHGCAEAYQAPVRQRLLRLARQRAAGTGLCRALARGSVWRLRYALRNRDPSEAVRITRFIAAAGFSGGRQAQSDASTVQERNSLPAEVYAW